MQRVQNCHIHTDLSKSNLLFTLLEWLLLAVLAALAALDALAAVVLALVVDPG